MTTALRSCIPSAENRNLVEDNRLVITRNHIEKQGNLLRRRITTDQSHINEQLKYMKRRTKEIQAEKHTQITKHDPSSGSYTTRPKPFFGCHDTSGGGVNRVVGQEISSSVQTRQIQRETLPTLKEGWVRHIDETKSEDQENKANTTTTTTSTTTTQCQPKTKNEGFPAVSRNGHHNNAYSNVNNCRSTELSDKFRKLNNRYGTRDDTALLPTIETGSTESTDPSRKLNYRYGRRDEKTRLPTVETRLPTVETRLPTVEPDRLPYLNEECLSRVDHRRLTIEEKIQRFLWSVESVL